MAKLVILGTLAAFLVTVFICHQQVSAYPTFLTGDDGMPMIVVDPDEYDDYVAPGAVMKRFFTNHPSDYNPMRRPGHLPRGSKRDDGIPLHPLARMQQGRRSVPEDYGVEDGYIENGRDKKQTRAATLIFRLGSLGMRRKPTVPPGPTA